MEEQSSKASENGMVNRKFELEGEDMKGYWRDLHHGELYNLYSIKY
jgi:hypothetical protein